MECFWPFNLERKVLNPWYEPSGSFLSEHMKELDGFVQMSVSIKAGWFGHFHGFVGVTLTSTLPESTWTWQKGCIYLKVRNSTFIRLKVSTWSK